MKTDVCINSGEWYVSAKPTVIYTVLGSCVAACLYDPLNCIGGMNHFILPGDPDLHRFNDSARYGINAMELLINGLMNLGANRSYLTAKVFGGGNILHGVSEEKSPGPQNARFVLDFMKYEKIKVASMDLGGKEGRKIFFNTHTGDVFLKHIKIVQYDKVLKEELKDRGRVRRDIEKTGDVTLF